MHYMVKDTEFKEMLKFFCKVKGIHRRDIDQLRKFIEAVYYICRSGCQWRLLPYYYGNWRSIHKRFKEWSNRGIWKKLFESCKIDPDMEYAMIDSTVVRSHACAAGYGKFTQFQEALGRSKGGFTTKIHALVDALGNPIKFILTAGQCSDITQAKTLCKDLYNTQLIADKAYDCDELIDNLNNKQCSSVIPCKSNRKIHRMHDRYIYKERHLIECFFGKIKYFRRIFSRYDKSSYSYLSFLYFVGALIWLK